MMIHPKLTAPISVLSLDAMGTLIRLRESPTTIYSRIAQNEFGIEPSRIPSEAQMNANFRQAFRQLELESPCYGFDQKEGTGYRSWWTELIARSFGPDLKIPQSLADRLIDHFGTREPWELTEPKLPEALKHFRHSTSKIPVKIMILSNFDSRLRAILEQFGISNPSLVDDFFLSGEFGIQKPGKEIFQRVQQQFGLPQNSPKALLHIGDNVERDLLAARRLGHQSLLYRPNGASRGDLDKAAEIGPNDVVASISKFLLAMSENE